MTPTGNGVALSDEIIAHCGDRAAGYDRENRFFTEDFEELRAAGYLKIAVPKELGGHGMSLADVLNDPTRKMGLSLRSKRTPCGTRPLASRLASAVPSPTRPPSGIMS